MGEFAARLKQKMNEKRINQSTLARRLNVTPTAVWNWENGNATPRQKTMSRLAQVLGADENWLRGGATVTEAAAEQIDSVGDEIERMQELVAELTGVEPGRVKIRIEIV